MTAQPQHWQVQTCYIKTCLIQNIGIFRCHLLAPLVFEYLISLRIDIENISDPAYWREMRALYKPKIHADHIYVGDSSRIINFELKTHLLVKSIWPASLIIKNLNTISDELDL